MQLRFSKNLLSCVIGTNRQSALSDWCSSLLAVKPRDECIGRWASNFLKTAPFKHVHASTFNIPPDLIPIPLQWIQNLSSQLTLDRQQFGRDSHQILQGIYNTHSPRNNDTRSTEISVIIMTYYGGIYIYIYIYIFILFLDVLFNKWQSFIEFSGQ